MTNYVCTELAPTQSGYVACKTWVAQDSKTNPVLSKAQVNDLGGVLVLFFGSLVGYMVLAKAIKIV